MFADSLTKSKLFLAAEYGKLPLIQPILHPGYHQYTDVANFASAGAGVLAQIDSY